MGTPTERTFQVSVPREGQRPLLYPQFPGAKALTCMQRFAQRGLTPVAHTSANGISESLTLDEMESIYGGEAESSMSPAESELTLHSVSGRNHGDDDDTVHLVWCNSGENAETAFKETLLAETSENESEDPDCPIYVNSNTLIGTVKNGVFVLSPNVLAVASAPPLHLAAHASSNLDADAADLDEEKLTAWFAQQIEDGHMELGRIPMLMARYALASPEAMCNEIAERMQMQTDDGEDGGQDAP